MPRNIILQDDQQENCRPMKHLENTKALKNNAKQSQMCQQDILADSNWRTNLMIQGEEEVVKRRNKGSRKNTSFQNKIINDHVWALIKQLAKLQKNSSIQQLHKICQQLASQQSQIKTGINQQKVKALFEENTYFTEDQKIELSQKFLYNFQNYQILNKVTTRLQRTGQFRQELVFMVVKIIVFIMQKYELKYRKYDQKFLEEEIPKTLNRISEYIVNHQNVKLINPQYFYNSNEPKYMRIIEVLFYCIFSIKLGLTDNKYLIETSSQKMQLQ